MIESESTQIDDERRRSKRVRLGSSLLSVAILITIGQASCSPRTGNPMSEAGYDRHILDAMRLAANGYAAGPAPAPAPYARGRWDDIDLAVYWAIAEPGVELATVRRRDFAWGFIYDLKTIEGWPGTLTIERVDGPRVYEVRASIGLFPGMHPEREQRLVEAVDRWMHDLGRKAR